MWAKHVGQETVTLVAAVVAHGLAQQAAADAKARRNAHRVDGGTRRQAKRLLRVHAPSPFLAFPYSSPWSQLNTLVRGALSRKRGHGSRRVAYMA